MASPATIESRELPPSDLRGERHWPFVTGIALAFAVSRALVFALGLRSSGELPQMHMIDRDLLANDLLRSLFFLHTQPPLFNAFLGALLKISGARFVLLVSISYWAIGLSLALMMYFLLVKLGTGRLAACGATLVFVLGPACLLYETYNLYTYPVAALLVAATLAAFRYVQSGNAIDAGAFGAAVTAVTLTRSLFHLVWVLAAIALVVLARRPSRKALALLSLPPVAVVLLYVKNAVLFGFFGASSLIGLNLFRITTEVQPAEVRLPLVEAARISPYALYRVNHPIGHYPVAASPLASLDFGAEASRSLLPWGWGRQEGPRRRRSVWSEGPFSVLVVPMFGGVHPLTLTLRCAQPSFPGPAGQAITVKVNGAALARVPLAGGAGVYRVQLPPRVLRRSWNIVSFHYAYTIVPRDIGWSRDRRELAVRWFGIDFAPPIGRSDLEAVRPADPVGAGVAVLERTLRLEGGPNLNHRLFPRVMKEYQRDALAMIRQFPGEYARAVLRAGLIFLAPPMEHPAFRSKRPLIASWDRFYSRWFYGARDKYWPGQHSHQSRWQTTRELLRRVSWTTVGLAILLLPIAAVRSLRQRRTPQGAALLFALCTLLFAGLSSSLLEYGENNRFRMEIEPILWVVLVASGSWSLAAARARKER